MNTYMKTSYFPSSRKKLWLMLFLCVPVWLQAQSYQITGHIYDEKQQPVEVANVILVHAADSSYIDACITEPDGSFAVTSTPGDRLLYIHLIGYEERYVPVSVNGTTHLGSLTLASRSIGLEAVTVVAAKPIVRREIDRIVFDASNSALAVGGSAMEVLQDVPGLMVDHRTIAIIGKGSVKVYVNNKEIKLSGDELTAYLRSFSSSDIESIEVYTVPPSRFEAAGNAGIINIRTKKQRADFIGGNLNTSYNYSQTEHLGYAGTNLMLNKNRISSFLNFSGMGGTMGYIERNETHYTESTWKSRSDVSYKVPTLNIEGGLDIRLNNDWNIGLQGRYNKRFSADVEEINRTDIYALQRVRPDSFYLSTDTRTNGNQQKQLNLHADKRFGGGKKMMWDADYLRYDRTNFNTLNSMGYEADGSVKHNSGLDYVRDENRKVDVYSGSLDFILPFPEFSMTTGGKFSHSDTRNDLLYEHSDLDVDQQDTFDYKESIYALYVDAEKAFADKFTLKAGIRMEHTVTNAWSPAEDARNKAKYTRLFPTVYMLYRPKEKHDVYFRFSNRISRPANNMINPFIMYVNKYNSYQGKPDLKPYYIYNAEVGYTFDNNLNVSLYYSQHSDGISQVSDIHETTSFKHTRWGNFLSERTLGVSNSYTFRTHWLQTFIQHGVNYRRSVSDSETTSPKEAGWQYYASIRHTFYFNRSKTFIGTLSGSFQSKQKNANGTMDPTYNLTAGVRYGMLNNKLHLSLTGSNLLQSNYKGVYPSNGIPFYTNNSYMFTTLRLGVSYSFGASLRSSKRNYSNQDLQNRL